MIILMSEKFKYQNELEIKKTYEDLVKDIGNLGLTCSCGCSDLSYFAKYTRNLITKEEVNGKITITRVICDSCEVTHAIVPYGVIPYKQHSLMLIMDVLEEANETSINNASNTFDIPRSSIYDWIKSLFFHMAFLMSLLKLKDKKEIIKVYLKNIYENTKKYFIFYNKVFLQIPST